MVAILNNLFSFATNNCKVWLLKIKSFQPALYFRVRYKGVHSPNALCLSKREIWKLSRGKQFIYPLSTIKVTRQDKVVQSIISTNDWLLRSLMFYNVISILVSYQCVLSFSSIFLNQWNITHNFAISFSVCILHYSVTFKIVLIPLWVNIIPLN